MAERPTPRVNKRTAELVAMGCDITYPAYQYAKLAAQLERELTEAREALAELVRLKDIHDQIELFERDYARGDLCAMDKRIHEDQLGQYHHGKPLAWQAARTALSAKEKP